MCRLVRIPAGSLAAVLLSLTAALQPSPCTRRTLTRRHGFFDVLSDAFANDDSNALPHDRAGLLSMRRGGRAFEFGLTPCANRALDATRIVVGEVLGEADGGAGLRLLSTLNDLPARQPSAVSELGGVAALYGLRRRLMPRASPLARATTSEAATQFL